MHAGTGLGELINTVWIARQWRHVQ